jgi:hypothetical protein
MSDKTRSEFELAFPLPGGVSFDGDHYVADKAVIGAFSNATIWSHMYRGWRMRQETLCVELPTWAQYDDEMCCGADAAISDCRSAIHAAGVKTK